MEQIKKHWKEIVICILLLFSMNKCTQSCSRGNKLNESEFNRIKTEIAKDSMIRSLNDSITLLNTKLLIYEEKVSGLSNALSIQDEANKRISEAKKNINVTVREKK